MKNYSPQITCLANNFNTTKCYLYLNEKLETTLYEGQNLLNKKTQLISKCRHQNKFMILSHDPKD